MNLLLVAGVDEAGRGPLAGPVAVAAVILDPARPVAGLGDSKALSQTRRETLAPLIRASCAQSNPIGPGPRTTTRSPGSTGLLSTTD